MPEDELPILRTKLFRSRPAKDIIGRNRLTSLLKQGFDCPLTLVSAPAGFGKSTLVGQCLDELGDEWKCGWYSVNASDDSLRTFLLYLVSAIRSVVPEACGESLELVRLEVLPSPVQMAACFGNELVRLGERIVVVIDDFHRLQEPAIGDFLIALLEHPPPNLHLVIVTRRDPSISLHRWRANGSVNEVRLDDLRFNEEEVEIYLAGSLEADALPNLSRAELERFEGWPVALRLLVLSLRGKRTPREITEALPSVPAKVSGYLIEGILDELDPEKLDALLKTSIPNRFSADLCAAILPGLDAPSFLKWLVNTDLCVIKLDDHGGSFRYHHFFQDALQQQFSMRYGEKEVREVHLRVAEWFLNQRQFDDAVTHALRAGEKARAGEIVALAVRTLAVQEDEVTRDRLIERLPEEVIQQSPALLVEAAWKRLSRTRDVKEAILRARESVSRADLEPEEERWLRGNIASLECFKGYEDRSFSKVIEAGEEARRNLPLTYSNLRTGPYMMGSLAHRSMGDGAAAQRLIGEGCAEFARDANSLGYMLSADAQGYLMAADMPGLKSSARYFFEHCDKHGFLFISSTSRALLGIAHYQLNDLKGAEEVLTISDVERIRMETRTVMLCRGYLVRTFAASGRWDDAEELIESIRDELRSRPNPALSLQIDALQAEVALRRGQSSQAIGWVKNTAPPARRVSLSDLDPAPTYIRALLAWGTAKARKKAADFLADIMADADLMRFNESRIQFRVLSALWHQQGGNDDEALDVLGEALRIAQPGGALRLFADFGTELVPLLQRLELDTEGVEYLGRIMHAMSPPSEEQSHAARAQVPTLSMNSHVETLSKREYEVLVVLAERLSNNEMGEKLFISAATVKRHLSNIYEKLGVHGRKEAVAKAIGLGLLKR